MYRAACTRPQRVQVTPPKGSCMTTLVKPLCPLVRCHTATNRDRLGLRRRAWPASQRVLNRHEQRRCAVVLFAWSTDGHSSSSSDDQGNWGTRPRASQRLNTATEVEAERQPSTAKADGDHPSLLSPLGDRGSLGALGVYSVLRVDSEGKQSHIHVSRKELLRTTGLRPRDLRRIDPQLSSFNKAPTILTRNAVILLNLMHLRVIVGPNYFYLIEPENTKAQALTEPFLETICERLQLRSELKRMSEDGALASYQPGAADQQSSYTVPFEVEVMEAALAAITIRMEEELMAILPKAENLLRTLPKRLTPERLEGIRQVKQQLVDLESRVEQVSELIDELLEDEEDIQGLLVSRKVKQTKTSEELLEGTETVQDISLALEIESEEEEVELVLEYYLQRSEAVHSEAGKLLEAARDMEDSISVNLSQRRYEVNRLELMLAMASFSTAVGALITGVFGMNLTSGLEITPFAFIIITVLIGCLSFTIFNLFWRYTKRRRIL